MPHKTLAAGHLVSTTATMRSDHILEESHLKVLCLLKVNPNIGQHEMTAAAGISLGKLNFFMNALIERGYVKMRNFNNRTSFELLLTHAQRRGRQDLDHLTASQAQVG